jgi:hypothetical protein
MTTSYFRKKLNKQLALASDEGFIQLLWAVNGIQSETRPNTEGVLLPFDEEFITTDVANKRYVYKWMIETLANEKLTVPHESKIRNNQEKVLDTRHLQNAINAANTLRSLENSEDGKRVKGTDRLVEMSRIASQQFAWQRGYLNKAQFYRNTYIYGQGACADYFLDKHGISINQFSLIGFALFAHLSQSPWAPDNLDISQVGMTQAELSRTLEIISLPMDSARVEATRLRRDRWPTAYKKSLLRQYPCIRFGNAPERIRAPLPQLILERVTSGIFYDVVGGGGDIRNDYGKRFEEYCISLLSAMLPEAIWESESKYKFRKNLIDTPDIRCKREGKVALVIECKSSRMSLEARYGEDPLSERGYDDLVKAVYQLWRYFSHCRRGLCFDVVTREAVGMVLTLDTWLMMAKPLQQEIMAKAVEMAANKDADIIDEDRRPVMFTTSPDLESTLQSATVETFLKAVSANSDPEYFGWLLALVHDKFKDPDHSEQIFPFRKELGVILPWWSDLEKAIGTINDTA